MRATTRFAIALLSSLVAGGSLVERAAAAPREVDFELVLMQNHSPVYLGTEGFVIRDQASWCALWRAAHANVSPQPPCDTSKIDFHHEIVLGVSGVRVGSCGGPHIERVERSGQWVRVIVSDITVAGCDCQPNGIIYPMEAVVVNKPVGTVEFDRDEIGFACTPEPIIGEPIPLEPPGS